ncbi:MAG: CRTAC1 family protein [Planctomycetes bacterium]|nr:CRTAC1 family protein [Planctomycetota bacterium]
MTRTRGIWVAAALAAQGLLGCGGGDAPAPTSPSSRAPGNAPAAPAAQSPPTFVEAAAKWGVDFTHVYAHEQRFWFPELASGALALFDYDGDGDLDLYCVQAGDCKAGEVVTEGNVLYRNDGGHFTDVTAEAGVGDTGYGHGVAVGDYDNDGDLDLYVANLYANVLYRNDGDGTFTDVTAQAGVGLDKWTVSCGFFDYDRDGDLDLFAVNNVNWSPIVEMKCETNYGVQDYCSPGNYNAPSVDTLYRNEGDGTFTDVTESSGISKGTGVGWGVAAADFNLDGWIDFYVTNDGMANLLWLNDQKGGFTDRALLLGCALNVNGTAEAGMGVQAVDVENDGDVDLFMTHMHNETNTFYLNKKGVFTDRTAATGLGVTSLLYTGFGMGFHDFDLDGELDLYIANGRVGLTPPHLSEQDPYAEPNQLYFGLGDGKFREDTRGPTAKKLLGTSRAAAFGDIDDDGDVDLVYMDWAAPVKLLENVGERRGGWIGFRVVGPHGSDALGATVEVVAGGRSQFRRCDPCYSFCSANDTRVHYGLGPAQSVEEVHVTWPTGERETFGPFEAGRYHTLRQGTGR